MKISGAFPSKFLKAADLQGREVTVTIDRVKLEEMQEGKADYKPVLYFVGKSKGLALNKTNAEKISSAYGDESEEWGNQPVVLYPDKTQFQGQLVDCIRVRVPARAVEPGEPEPF